MDFAALDTVPKNMPFQRPDFWHDRSAAEFFEGFFAVAAFPF
jgi:hypothetical protein